MIGADPTNEIITEECTPVQDDPRLHSSRFDEFSEDELSHLAARAYLPEKLVLDTARETVALFHQHWHAEKTHLPLTHDAVHTVQAHLRRIPITRAGKTDQRVLNQSHL